MRFLLLAAAATLLSGSAFAQDQRDRDYRAYDGPQANPSQSWNNDAPWGHHRRSSAPSWGLHGGSNPMGSDANGA